MMIVALLIFLLIKNGSAVGETEMSNQTGFVGHNILLLCNCSIEFTRLVWQINEKLVNVYPQNESDLLNETYINRTELFLEKEKKNCSLMIFNLSVVDTGVYTCHIMSRVAKKIWKIKSHNFNLTVSNATSTHNSLTGNPEYATQAVSISVPILAIVLILAVAIVLTFLIRRRHRTNMDMDSPAQEPMIKVM